MTPPDLTIEQLMGILTQELPKEKFRDIRYHNTAETRRLLKAKWGIDDNFMDVMLKVDKNPEKTKSPRAKRHIKRGCTNLNDIKHLIKLGEIIDFYDFRKTHGFTVLVEPFYKDYITLQELVKDSPLNKNQFEKIFLQILEKETKLMRKNEIYHRDVSPSNILVKPDDLETHIVDYANACNIEEAVPQFLPTAGAHWISDPLLFSCFTGEESAYDESSEIYSLGVDMLYALTKKYAIEVDPDEKTLTDKLTGESLLDKDERVDKQKCKTTLENALKNLPKDTKKYGKIIRKCMTLDKTQRYTSIDNLLEDFEKATKPTIFERLKSNWKKAVVVLTAGTLLAGYLGLEFHKAKQEKIKLEQIAEKYEVGVEWNGWDPELSNNLIELEIYIRVNNKSAYPENGCVKVNLEDNMWADIRARNLARPKRPGLSSPSLEGRIYIEGFEGEDFTIWPANHDEADTPYGGMVGCAYPKIVTPKDIKDGNYNLIIEIYSPIEEEQPKCYNTQNIKFGKPKMMINRKIIPFIVGNPKNKVKIGSIQLNWNSGFSLRNAEDRWGSINRSLTYEISIPEENFKTIVEKGSYVTFDMPKGTDTESERTLQIVIKDRDKFVGYAFLPIKLRMACEGGVNQWGNHYDPIYNWELSTPDKEFHKKLIKYRKAIYEQLDNQPR